MKCIICHKTTSNYDFYRRNSSYKSCDVCSDKSILRRQNIKKRHEQEVKEIPKDDTAELFCMEGNDIKCESNAVDEGD